MSKKREYILTQDNTEEIIAVVNRFLEKPTVRLRTGKVVGGVKIIKDSIFGSFPIHGYRKGIIRTPFLGNCHVHYLQSEESAIRTRDMRRVPLLAISKKYDTSCLPMFEGTIIVIKGKRMSVQDRIDEESIRFVTYMHEEYTNDALLDVHCADILSSWMDYCDTYDMYEYLKYDSKRQLLTFIDSMRDYISDEYRNKVKETGTLPDYLDVTIKDLEDVELAPSEFPTIVAHIDFRLFKESNVESEMKFQTVVNGTTIENNEILSFAYKVCDAMFELEEDYDYGCDYDCEDELI